MLRKIANIFSSFLSAAKLLLAEAFSLAMLRTTARNKACPTSFIAVFSNINRKMKLVFYQFQSLCFRYERLRKNWQELILTWEGKRFLLSVEKNTDKGNKLMCACFDKFSFFLRRDFLRQTSCKEAATITANFRLKAVSLHSILSTCISSHGAGHLAGGKGCLV